MVRIGGGIGDAAARQMALPDHRHAQVSGVPQQVRVEQDAARPAADNQNVTPAGFTRKGAKRSSALMVMAASDR